jgi:hypothetical protein
VSYDFFASSVGRSIFSTLSAPSKYTMKWRHTAFVESPTLEVVDVVPARALERIRDHRRAEQGAHLNPRHADGDAIDVFLVQEISLLNVDSMHAGAQHREHQGGDEKPAQAQEHCHFIDCCSHLAGTKGGAGRSGAR